MSNATKFTGFSFDATNIKPAAPMEPFPADFYPVAITDGEIKPTSDGSGQRLNFELTVLEGTYKGRKVWDGLNIVNKSAQAQQIAHEQLSAICHATGVVRMQDIQELFNKPFTGKIGFEPRREDPKEEGKFYDARNTFKGAKPLTATGAAPAVAAGGPAPSWAKPAAPTVAAPTPPPAAPQPPKPAVQAPVVKILMMTAKANGMTAEQFRASDKAWTDELLVREGYAELKEVAAPAPAAPALPPAAPAAATPAGAPVRPPWAV